MHDGTTPLILAARLAIEGMVEDLINADADINAADNSGKTALHWGAAVNNVDAVNILLSHGANRDAQDDKVSKASFHLVIGLISNSSEGSCGSLVLRCVAAFKVVTAAFRIQLFCDMAQCHRVSDS